VAVVTAQTIEADQFSGGAWVGYSAGLVKLSSTGTEEWRRSSGSNVSAIALHSSTSQGRTIFVDTGGSDTTGDGSQSSPYATIVNAVIEANSGDTINVAAGTYTGNIPLKSGIKLLGAGADVTTIQGPGTSNVIDGRNVQKVIISGFTIAGAGDGNSGIFCQGCNGVIIRSNRINDNGTSSSSFSYGIELEGSTSALIEKNEIARNPRFGILISVDSYANVRNNIITDNGTGGILLTTGSTINAKDSYILNNVIDRNGGTGIDTRVNDVISNNIISNNQNGIIVTAGGLPLLSYNNFYNNLQANYTGIIAGTGDISQDPLFVNPTASSRWGRCLHGCCQLSQRHGGLRRPLGELVEFEMMHGR
jgi:parallel beta-helix repeat protein